MDEMNRKKISAIFRNEAALEVAIHHLTQTTLALNEVSVQGAPDELRDKFGMPYMKPETLQKNEESAPKKEPYMRDDFGWLLGFSFSIPMVIGIILGLLAGGDLHYELDNIIFGIIGGVIGGFIGYLCMNKVYRWRILHRTMQENKGGFVLWAISTDEEQMQKIIAILKEHNAENIVVQECGSSDKNPRAAIQQFFTSPAYAVVGASSDRVKFGNKVLRCYMQHNKKVYPVNLSEEMIEGLPCLKQLEELPAEVKSISIITPPAVTERIVHQAIAKGIKNIWMQPGAESQAAIDHCRAHQINVIANGPCILVELGCSF